MWTRGYLYLQAILYVLLAAWCTVDPYGTSRAIGFGLTSGSGLSEFVTVYGGLELGMGLFFLVAAQRADWCSAGLAFALCAYACLAVFRLGTLILIEDVGFFPRLMLSAEVTMATLAALLLRGRAGDRAGVESADGDRVP